MSFARGDVAAFVVEPIQGKGVNVASEEYWAAAAELCRKHGTLLVIDEVQTGLARTGRFWAYEHYGLRPTSSPYPRRCRADTCPSGR